LANLSNLYKHCVFISHLTGIKNLAGLTLYGVPSAVGRTPTFALRSKKYKTAGEFNAELLRRNNNILN
jgi:hypothetical protein